MNVLSKVKNNATFTSLAMGTLLILGGLFSLVPASAETTDKPETTTQSGMPEDDAYAAKVWEYMVANKLVGDNRIRSYTFEGTRPHGSIQDVVIIQQADIDGHTGRLIVKHNYGSKDEEKKLTPKEVYKGSQAENLEAVTIMFQREAGYDPDNNNWFWAEYKPDSSIIVYEGQRLSGRSPLCIGCHTALGGKDLEIINGKE